MQAWVVIHVTSSYQLPGAFPTELAAARCATEIALKTGHAFVAVERLIPKNRHWPLAPSAPLFLRELLWGERGIERPRAV